MISDELKAVCEQLGLEAVLSSVGSNQEIANCYVFYTDKSRQLFEVFQLTYTFIPYKKATWYELRYSGSGTITEAMLNLAINGFNIELLLTTSKNVIDGIHAARSSVK